MKFLTCCLTIAMMLSAPLPSQAGCYRVQTYVKQAYVAPVYVAPVYVVPVVALYSVGYGYSPPPPPLAAPVHSPCTAELAALKLELKALKLDFERALRGPGQEPSPRPLAAPPADPAPKPGDLSWLTGASGCAACHAGKEPAKGLDLTRGLDGVSGKQLLGIFRVLKKGSMPPADLAEYTARGIQGPHPKPTPEQLAALEAAVELASK